MIAAPAAVLLAAGGDAYLNADVTDDAKPVDPVVQETANVEIVAATPLSPAPDTLNVQPSGSFVPGQVVAAARYRVYNREAERVLPVGLAPERGLQVKTILASRAISAMFPEIHNIGGVRPDALRWHPNGLALDVMIPDPTSAEGIALGNRIVEFALENAKRFALQDCIWRGVYYTPGGAKAGGYGHYDHVHITTLGGGYPTGGEIYVR